MDVGRPSNIFDKYCPGKEQYLAIGLVQQERNQRGGIHNLSISLDNL
jgi:hypothetical protein